MKKLICFLLLTSLFFSCEWSFDKSSDYSSTGTGGSMAKFTCIGDHLYVVDESYLQTFDISDSSKITRTSRILSSWNNRIETIFPKDSLLFLGSTSGMYIFNLKDPANPKFVYLYTHVTSCDPVIVQGKYAFVTLRTDNDSWLCSRSVDQLEVIDISNTSAPRNVGTYPMVNPRGLSIDGKNLFICDGMDLLVMDATDPLALTQIKRIELDGTPYDVIAKNGILTLSYQLGIKQYAYSNDTIQEISTLY
ncbi:MAG TPA: hypothetical protein VFP20_07020 [Bacteroidales bacterium]|nr:hypothetical protein [Bacteroidales bacterium]